MVHDVSSLSMMTFIPSLRVDEGFLSSGLRWLNVELGDVMRETAIVTVMLMAACATHAAETTTTQMPDMVVTPTGQASPISELGSSISVITGKQIEDNGWRTLPEALRAVPGLHVAASGAPGSTTTMFLRGSRTAHVVVLIDGVRINDPSGPTRAAYISGVDLSNVERIEVVRGPQSGLYGADAIAGVINIITKKAEEGVKSSVTVEAGSYETYRVGAALTSKQGILSGVASVSYLDSKGFSSANERYAGNDEADGFENFTASLQIGVKPSDSLSVDTVVRYTESQSEYDAGAGPAADADGNEADSEQVLAGIRTRFGASDAAWRQALNAQFSSFERTFKDSWGNSAFEGENWEAEWRHDFNVGKGHTLSAAASYRDESAETSSLPSVSADNIGVLVQDQLSCGSFDAVANVRYDDHEVFGDEVTYRVAPSYAIENSGTRFKASVGTGYKAPSLYQLYGPASPWGKVGNTELKPETSLGWDAGVEQMFADGLVSVGFTCFARDVEDQIEYLNGYENLSEAEHRGVELQASFNPTEALSVNASYTYTEAEDKDTGEQLIRVPKDRATLGVNYAIAQRANLSASVLYVGSRNDRYYDSSMYTSLDAVAGAYTVVNLAANMAVTDNVSVFGRVDNLFDEEYEEVYGYGTAGLSGYGGVKVAL